MESPARDIVVIGAGPAGLTAALLLAEVGHRVTVIERSQAIGGLWASARDGAGAYQSENSCKVYQESYHTAPALFKRIGTRWEDHFVPRFDLTRDWIRPFLRACSPADVAKLARGWLSVVAGRGELHEVAVSDWLETRGFSDPCCAWMRATALGGITGTTRMTVWELFNRFRGNVVGLFTGGGGTLYWNRQPPDGPGGFLAPWKRALAAAGVRFALGEAVEGLDARPDGVTVRRRDGTSTGFDAAFLAVPPRALGALFGASPGLAERFGEPGDRMHARLGVSLYEHLGITWHFGGVLPKALPLGGHNVRRGWHPILVEHPQYAPGLRGGSVVVGSISLDTEYRHPRLGTRARDHTPADLARILWDDERAADPSLPDYAEAVIHGMSDATQIVRHGPLPMCASGAPVWLATNMSGAAPYFTASLESAIQAGAAAAAAFEPRAARLPTGPPRRHPWSEGVGATATVG